MRFSMSIGPGEPVPPSSSSPGVDDAAPLGLLPDAAAAELAPAATPATRSADASPTEPHPSPEDR